LGVWTVSETLNSDVMWYFEEDDEEGGRREGKNGIGGKRLTQTGRFVNKRQRTLHSTGQGINALVEQRPAAEQDIEWGVGTVIDVEG